jgi:hypothetical protein
LGEFVIKALLGISVLGSLMDTTTPLQASSLSRGAGFSRSLEVVPRILASIELVLFGRLV